MKRKDFITLSALTLGGISLIPVRAFSLNPSSFYLSKLKMNRHNRHGYYGTEFITNTFGDEYLKSIRLDVFDNPDGDMSLLDINYRGKRLFISILSDELIISTENDTREFTFNNSSDFQLASGLQLLGKSLEIEGKNERFIIDLSKGHQKPSIRLA